jgi:hypothetical protein
MCEVADRLGGVGSQKIVRCSGQGFEEVREGRGRLAREEEALEHQVEKAEEISD